MRRGLGILVATASVLTGCVDRPGDSSPRATEDAPTSVVTTTASGHGVDAPGTATVATSSVSVSVIDVDGGDVVARLDGGRLSDRAVQLGGVAVHPDGDAVYVVALIDARRAEIHRVDLGGGSELVAVGADVAVSPDGRYIAHSQPVERPGGHVTVRREDLVVRDLATGAERRWENAAPTDPDLAADLGSLSWSSDSRRVAFHIRFEDGVEVRVLDTHGGDSVLDGRRVEPPEGTAFAWPAYRGRTGALTVVEQRGGLDPSIAPERFAIVEVDDDTGDVGSTLVESARPVIGLDFDITGQHLLVLTGHDEDARGGNEPNRLLRWSGTDLETVPIDEDPVSAAW